MSNSNTVVQTDEYPRQLTPGIPGTTPVSPGAGYAQMLPGAGYYGSPYYGLGTPGGAGYGAYPAYPGWPHSIPWQWSHPYGGWYGGGGWPAGSGYWPGGHYGGQSGWHHGGQHHEYRC